MKVKILPGGKTTDIEKDLGDQEETWKKVLGGS